MKKTLHILLLGMLMSTSALFAQVVTIPYTMSFEASEAAELANWTINAGPAAAQCTDRWTVGNGIHSDGHQSLYIVNGDDADVPTFGTDQSLQFAYRDFELPAGVFDFSFDWQNVGASNAMLYVGYVWYLTASGPNTNANRMVASATNGTMVSQLIATTGKNALWNQEEWKTERLRLTNTNGNRTFRVFFAWSNTGAAASGMAAAIDNLQITDASCIAPDTLYATEINCDSIQVNWVGYSSSYQVQYRKIGTDGWSTRASQPNASSLILEGLAEGTYEMRVRGVCQDTLGNNVYSAYTYLDENFLLYCAENHCMKYFDLDDPSVVCYYGTTNYDGYSQSGQNAYQNIGKIDYGPESQLSRHTVNWDKTATDPRTGGQLSLIPQGMIASVRLGNWQINNGAEAVTYTYTVDSAYSILLMKYAVVMEDPGHLPDEQPRFILEVLDMNGQKVQLCGDYNFYADTNRPGWNTYGSGYDAVTWKDWSTVGVRLDQYIGQTVMIRVTTYDCFQSGHYGYAYFTLDCASATIAATSCGENTRLQASAPDGFSYEWTDPFGNVLGTTRDLDIQTTDSFTYTCWLSDLEHPDCSFDLQIKALPRFPMVSFIPKYDPADCQNRYVFTNKSYIQTRFDGVIENYFDQDVDNYEWYFSDDNTTDNQKDVVHTFPQSGGTFYVTLAGWLAESPDKNSACYKDTTITIVVPHIGDTLVQVDSAICQGDWVELNGIRFTKDTVVTAHTYSRAGCDSVNIVTIRTNPTYLQNRADSICFGDELCFGEDCWDHLTLPWKRSLRTSKKCDSIVIVDVVEMPRIEPVVTIHEQETLRDTAYIAIDSILSKGFIRFEVRNEDNVKMESLKGLLPGIYTLHYYNEIACERIDTAEIALPCLNAIYQRWDDVLSLMNDSIQKLNNYGNSFDYVTFMWVKDGMPLVNETRSYYYEEGGLTGEYYTCIVTDATGKERQICEFEPIPFTPTSGQVQVRKTMKNGELYVEVNGVLYDTTGARIN